MRSEKYRNRQNPETIRPKKDDYWEETQILFRNKDDLKEEVRQQNLYEERRSRAAAYKEYLAMRENPDGNRSPEMAGRSRRSRSAVQEEYPGQMRSSFESDNRGYSYSSEYNSEKIKKKKPILSDDMDREEEKEVRREAKRRRKESPGNTSARGRNDGDTGRKSGRKSSKGSGGGPKKGKKKILMALLVIAVIIGAMGLMLTGILGKVGKIDINKDNIGINEQVAKDLKKYRNIILLGVDARDMDDYENCRTDAMIMVSIDKKNNEIRQISVYRDTYVYANEEYGYDKITNIHAYAGTEGTMHALNENLDLNIEEVVVVNWKAVANAIDALGGIEIEVLDSEINELNKYMNETARSIGGKAVKVEKAGVQTLDGVQAVTYSRIRKDAATGDYRRNERMKIVVSATVEKALKNPWKIPKAANVALPQIRTNMTTGDMMGAMMAFLTKDMTDSVGWPFDTSGWTAYNGAWCGVPVTLNSNVTELHEKYFGQAGYTPTEKVQEISAEISARTGYY